MSGHVGVSGGVGELSPLRTFGPASLRRRWKLIAGCAALFLTAGLLISVLKPSRYTSTTQLLVYVRQLQSGPDLVISPGRADLTQVENEIEIIRSRGMLAKVVGALKLADDSEIVAAPTLLQSLAERIFRRSESTADGRRSKLERAVEFLEKHVTAKRVGTSHTIQVSVTTSDPRKSERIANAISEVALQARVSAEQEGNRSPLLRERLQGLGPNAYVMTTASAAYRPDGPRKIIVILAALLSGLVVGSALAVILDLINRTIRTATQVEHFGIECIGAIPRLRQRPSAGADRSASSLQPAMADESRSDAMLDQTLCRTIAAVAASKARTVGIVSAAAREGTTTVARYLAQMAACSRKKVLLVEAGESEPASVTGNEIRRIAGSPDEYAPHNVVAQEGCASPDILKVDHASCAHGSAPWRKYYAQDRLGSYDLVIVSLPPLESGPEFRMAAQGLDGILLVIKWGSTEFERLDRTIAASGVAPSEFIGAILNMTDDRMIGKFGDRLWAAQAALGRRRPFAFPVSAQQPVG